MNGERITNKIEAKRLLEKIRKQHTLLQVSVPGIRDVFFSTILKIDEEANVLLLDELNSRLGHTRLLEEKKLDVQTRVNNVNLHFSTDLINTEQVDGIAVYIVNFPDVMHYAQKRQSFRINIGLGTNIPVKLKRDDGTPVHAKINNLSDTGAGIILNTNDNLQVGEILPICELRITPEDSILCQFEIRYTKHDKENNRQSIGGKFIGLSGAHQRELGRLVLELQRDMMRRLPKSDTP